MLCAGQTTGQKRVSTVFRARINQKNRERWTREKNRLVPLTSKINIPFQEAAIKLNSQNCLSQREANHFEKENDGNLSTRLYIALKLNIDLSERIKSFGSIASLN